MSMKTRVLLQRAGRDQFGDPGESYSTYHSPGLSRAENAEYHAAVEGFSRRHRPAWRKFCAGRTSREIWEALFPRGKPALSTFDRQRRAFVSLDEFLRYALVLYHWQALMAMGHSHAGTRSILRNYEPLDRYCIEPKVGERKPGRTAGYVPRRY